MTHRPFAIAALASVLVPLWLSMASISATGSPSPDAELITNASAAFRHAVDTPSAAIPASVLQRARAIAVIPGASADGPYFGRGIVSARGRNATTWTAPSVIAFQGRIPFRLDVDTIDFIIVALTPNGLEYLKRADVSLTKGEVIAPGPLGQDASEKIDADLIAYARFENLFAGITIRELTLCEDQSANARIYGKTLSTADVFLGGFWIPAAAQSWRDTLASYFKEMS